MSEYRHTQVGFLMALVMALPVVVLLASYVSGAPGRLVAPFAVMFAGLLLLFPSLTVTVDDDVIECRFGFGPIRRRVRLAEVAGVDAVRNGWWYGLGIRYTPHGWLWNIGGLDAVELTFRDGRRFRIGTDEPGELARAIGRRIDERGSRRPA